MLSFAYVGSIWNNHHHLLHSVEHVNGRVLWANLFLMFCLSLLPFVTAWMGESHYASFPTALYGVVMLFLALAWYLLLRSLIACNGGVNSILARTVGHRDPKTLTSAGLNIIAIPSALLGFSWVAVVCYLAIAGMWIIPDRRIESKIGRKAAES